MKMKRLLFLSLLLIASMVIASCGGSEAAAPEQKPQATPVAANTESKPSEPKPLDPANAEKSDALSYVYEGLLRLEDGAPVSALATSYEVSEDGLEYTFNLRPGVTFHDGSMLNADVALANFNRWFDPADPNRGGGNFDAWLKNFNGFKGEVAEDGKPKSQYDGIEKVNDYTVLIHLNTPDPDFPAKIADPAFVIMSASGFTGGDGGSGPYMIASSDAKTLKLEPFSGYWNPTEVPASGMEVSLP